MIPEMFYAKFLREFLPQLHMYWSFFRAIVSVGSFATCDGVTQVIADGLYMGNQQIISKSLENTIQECKRRKNPLYLLLIYWSNS